MTNPFARTLLIASRLERAVPPATLTRAGPSPRKRWDAPRHWLSRSARDG